MIEKIIIDYLAVHKRLVVPQLGAFIVKQPDGKILFSELLKRDDGVLRGLLCAGGMTEVQAMGVINRLVFDVRDAVGRGDRFEVKGLGAFYPAPNHTIRFVDAQSLRAAVARAAAEADDEAERGSEKGSGRGLGQSPGEDPESGRSESGHPEDRTGGRAAAAVKGAEGAAKEAAERAVDEAAEEISDGTPDGTSNGTPDGMSDETSDGTLNGALNGDGRDARTPKPRRADPAVRGLRYGDTARRRGKGTVDKFLIIAIVIALVAVGIIAYVYVSGRELERDKAELLAPDTETEYVEDLQ